MPCKYADLNVLDHINWSDIDDWDDDCTCTLFCVQAPTPTPVEVEEPQKVEVPRDLLEEVSRNLQRFVGTIGAPMPPTTNCWGDDDLEADLKAEALERAQVDIVDLMVRAAELLEDEG